MKSLKIYIKKLFIAIKFKKKDVKKNDMRKILGNGIKIVKRQHRKFDIYKFKLVIFISNYKIYWFKLPKNIF